MPSEISTALPFIGTQALTADDQQQQQGESAGTALSCCFFSFSRRKKRRKAGRLLPDVMLDPTVVILQGFCRCLSQINSFSRVNLLMSLGPLTWKASHRAQLFQWEDWRGGGKGGCVSEKHTLGRGQCFNLPLESYTHENSLNVILFAHGNTILTGPAKEHSEARLMTWKATFGMFSHLQDNVERKLQAAVEDLH